MKGIIRQTNTILEKFNPIIKKDYDSIKYVQNMTEGPKTITVDREIYLKYYKTTKFSNDLEKCFLSN